MRGVGEKIRSRICAIRGDYDEKIRACDMRIDSIAMATQWVSIQAFDLPISS